MIDLGHGQCTHTDGKRCPQSAINDSGLCWEHMEQAIPKPEPSRSQSIRDEINALTHYGYDTIDPVELNG